MTRPGERGRGVLGGVLLGVQVGVLALTALVAGMAAHYADTPLPDRRRGMLMMAAFAGGAAVLQAGLLGYLLLRRLLGRLNPDMRPHPLGHQDLWAEGGRRIRPEDAPPVTPYEIEE